MHCQVTHGPACVLPTRTTRMALQRHANALRKQQLAIRCKQQRDQYQHIAVSAAAIAHEPYQLAAIAAEPVVRVSVLCGVGALCAKQGVLTQQGRRLLSGLIMNVFTPALLFSKLGSSLDADQALSLWPLAANMVACHALGLLLGWAQSKVLDAPANLRPQMVVMSAVGNIGNLPLVLVPALATNPTGLLGSSATSDVALTYVMLGFFVASFIQFPCGYLLLQPGEHVGIGETSAAAAAATATNGAITLNIQQQSQQQQQQQLSTELVQPAVSRQHLSSAALTVAETQQQSVRRQQSVKRQQQLQTLANGVLTPPVIACLLSVPVATSPPLRQALFNSTGSLAVVGDVVTMLGAPLIPCLFLVLGANLAGGPGAAKVPAKYIISMVLCKQVLHPLAGMALVLTSIHSRLVHVGPDDSLLPLVMMLVWATPTAVLVHSLATMLQSGEDEVSCFLFWQYLTSLVTLPGFMALQLQLMQSGALVTPAGL